MNLKVDILAEYVTGVTGNTLFITSEAFGKFTRHPLAWYLV